MKAQHNFEWVQLQLGQKLKVDWALGQPRQNVSHMLCTCGAETLHFNLTNQQRSHYNLYRNQFGSCSCDLICTCILTSSAKPHIWFCFSQLEEEPRTIHSLKIKLSNIYFTTDLCIKIRLVPNKKYYLVCKLVKLSIKKNPFVGSKTEIISQLWQTIQKSMRVAPMQPLQGQAFSCIPFLSNHQRKLANYRVWVC